MPRPRVGAAMRRFASLTVAERRAAIPLDNAATRPSGNHSLSLPANDVAAMEDAHTDDIAADLYCSLSEWVTAALTLATNTTRDRNVGTLPPAPARLPKRLVR